MRLIVNADDFGASEGINRGILRAHTDGILTSTSLMVTGAAAAPAARLAAAHPRLGVGLHWDLDGHQARPELKLNDPDVVAAELRAQLERFHALVGRSPTHLDSHHHIHRRPGLAAIVREVAQPLGLPVRLHDPRVCNILGFYGQREDGEPDPDRVTVDFLIGLLDDLAQTGWTEIVCHPGYMTADFRSSYRFQREAELRTLTDPRVGREILARGIRLTSFHDLSAIDELYPQGRS